MRRTVELGAAVLLTMAVVMPAAAVAQGKQVYVLESTAPAVKAGSAYAETDRIEVPAGASVRVVLPSGKTQTLKGPLSKTVLELGEGQETHGSVMTWLKTLMQTGGSQERTPGATRSARPQAASAPFSWTAIPVRVDGTFCIRKGAEVQLRRAPSSAAERVMIVDEAKGQRGEAEFKAGSETAPWPPALPASGTYSLTAGSKGSRVTLTLLDKLPAEDDTLTELANRQCKHQFDAWVKQKLAGIKAK